MIYSTADGTLAPDWDEADEISWRWPGLDGSDPARMEGD